MKRITNLILLAAAVAAASAIFPLRADVSYYDPVGKSNAVCKAYKAYTGQNFHSGWYLLTGNITNNTRIVVEGDAHLILADGASLTVRNIEVCDGLSFTVWAQSDGANMGKLMATGGSGAGIGGRHGGSVITVTVNGGEVTAKGGEFGAGIGGGEYGKNIMVTINGGKVTATGGDDGGAGIGGGYDGSDITVTVNGGEVEAKGGKYAAGIGGGDVGSGVTVTIAGGEVEAQGGEFGAGIGGGDFGFGVTVKINPVAGKLIEVEAGADAGSAAQVAGSPFAIEPDVTELLAEKDFVRTRAVMGYLDPTDPDNPVKTLDDYAYYAGETTLTSGWYVVTGDITNNTRIVVEGDAHLILADGASLTATDGINVEVKNNVTNSLTIWAQSDGADMGRLTATGGYGCAGIGGGSNGSGITVTINGGEVTAKGGHGCAGIGGGSNGSGITVTINGGEVTAKCGEFGAGIDGAGIGGGVGGSDITVTINGGKVTAEGSNRAAGIGGGEHGSDITVTINGGEVEATGGGGAGIGGGFLGSGITVTINGGNVEAKGNSGGAGIGGGQDSYGITVTINGGEVTATGGYADGIGGGLHGYDVTVTVKPLAGMAIAVAAGDDEGSAAPVSGSPFMAETDVTSLLSGKKFVRTRTGMGYLDPTDPDNPVKTLDDYAYYAGETTLTSGWYVVTGDITNDASITVSGNVNLILADGASLTANKGIRVDGANRLTVWAQSDGANMGKLSATGNSGSAGIGGGNMGTGGTVTITGGKVTAQGGVNAAGIGGGCMGTGVTVTINGGEVTATGGDHGAGIGGGSSASGITVTIAGGEVEATGGDGGAGIGGGNVGSGVSVRINGGEVEATGGDGGAGIGGGYFGFGVTVKINPVAGKMIAVEAGADSGSAAPVAGSPFAAETDVTSLLAEKGFAQTRTGIGYLDPTDPANPVKVCDDYAPYTGQTTLDTGWYVVDGSVTKDARIIVNGNVNLLLLDNAELTANYGITVDVNNNITNSLTIWAQSDGANMGKLTAKGQNYNAGIGGGDHGAGGTVTVNGGAVTATGNNAAGIGGGWSGAGGKVTVNGGELKATGHNGSAGIGGGSYGVGGTVTVNGGEVTAQSDYGAGIGGGQNGSGGTVTVNGGKVTAQSDYGAGIGGGYNGSGGTVTVNPSAGTAIAVAAGADAGSAAPIDGSPFMAETDVTGRVEGKKFVRTWEPQFRAVTVVGGSTTNSPALEGSVVTVVADEPEPDHAFVQWARCDGVDFADASAAETTFTMPTNDVTVTAVFAEIRIGGLDGGGYPWTGRPVEPEVAVELDGGDGHYERGTDYAVSYADNVDPGTATLTVTMLPPGLGSRTATFTILPLPSVSNVAAAVRGPWNGKVELTFATDGNWSGLSGWNAPVLSIVATDHLTGSNYVADVSALSARAPYQLADALAGVPGPHEVTWDFTAQGIDFSSTNVTFTVAYLRMPDYCVIDLSGGKDAAHYPVSYLDAEPEGGFTNDLYRTTKLAMRLLAPGTFQMGVDGSDPNNPSHTVTLTQPFYCAVFETTQKQWELVQGPHESGFAGDTRPVETVSYNDIRGSANVAEWPATNEVEATFFLGKLRSKTGIASLDLPTEAQWEYACRAGTETKYCCADSEIGNYAWYSTSATHEVGAKRPNAWGLYDMHGNVWEWCLDWSDFSSLSAFAVTNPLSSSGSGRVKRGGGWSSSADYCTSSYRYSGIPSGADDIFGFRLVRTLSDNLEGERSAEAAAGAERAGTVCAGTSAPVAVGMREFAADDIKLTPYEGVYDGQGHGIGIETNAIEGLELRYAVGEGGSPGGLAPPSGGHGVPALPDWGDVPPTFTDVTNVTVWVEASAPNYVPVTNSATVTIAQRTVTLTSGSAEKVYDGTPVTCADVLVGAAGFAPGEGATFDVTGSQTHVGSSENFFTYVLNDGTLAGNYAITTSNGTLTVTKATNAWTADPSIAGWTYGEAAGVPDMGGATFGTATVTYSAEVGDAGDYTATFTVAGTEDYEGLTFEVPFTIARATFAAGDIALADYEGVYDGEGHGIGIETNAIDGLVLRYAVGEGGSPGGLASPSGGHGVPALPVAATSAALPLFTNVCEATVWVEASAPNYVPVTNSVTVKITARQVTLTSGSASKVYDGSPVLCADIHVGADGFAPGEGATFDVTGSQTDVGSSGNTFTYALNEGTLAGNYEITMVEGTLTVEPAEPEPQPEPQPEPPAGRRVLWPTDAPFQLDRMTTYNGYLLDANANDAVVGVIAVKAGKPSKNTGISRLTVTIRLTGQKAITVRGRTVDGTFRAMAGGRALDIALGLHSLSGAFGSYLVDGSRDMFSARDADSKSRAAQALSRWKGNYVAAWQAAGATDAPYNTLSITVKKKGRVTVKGTLANGTRVSANTRLLVGGLHRRMDTGSMLLVGEKECAVAVSWAKKGASVACLLWFGEDGTVSCESLNDGSVAVAAPVGAGLAAGATLRIDQAAVAAAFPGISVERSFPGGVPAKLSLRYGKDGTFGGSFKVYVDSGVSFRQKTVKVSGVVLDGIGYGVAYVKNVGDWKITVE